MIEQSLTIEAESEASLAAALVSSGLLIGTEGGLVPNSPVTIYSPLPATLDGKASCFVRFQAIDQETVDAILAVIGLDNVNRPHTPLRSIAGALQTKPNAWPRWAIKFGLTLGGYRQDWETAINTLSGAPDATNAAKLIPDRWAENDWLTLDEPWVLRIINQMRIALAWTPAQRTQFVNQLKNRATAQVAAAND